MEVVDQDGDPGSGQTGAEADVVQAAVVAQRDGAAFVDLVGADAVVLGDDGAACDGFGARGVGLVGRAALQRSVRSDGVERDGTCRAAAEFGQGGRGWLGGQPLLLGLVEALDFPAGLGVVGAGVAEPDPEGASSISSATRPPRRGVAVKMAPLSLSTQAGFPCLRKALRKLWTTSPAVVEA